MCVCAWRKLCGAHEAPTAAHQAKLRHTRPAHGAPTRPHPPVGWRRPRSAREAPTATLQGSSHCCYCHYHYHYYCY
eukprot:4775682-Pyramimonas_sp.AAC.1